MAGIWESLDQLGAKASDLAGKYLEYELIKRTQGTSAPAVAAVPNATAAVDTSAAGKTDPNVSQRYLLWGAVGAAAIVLVVIGARALRR